MNRVTRLIAAMTVVVVVCPTVRALVSLPKAWQSDWTQPPVTCRPLQIVHGVPAQQATPEAMKHLKDDLGLGGVVCNVAFGAYLRSEENWRILEQVLASCKRVGLRVWIYDEDGYPSGGAGGIVLDGHPELESLALAYDASRDDPFVVRPAYEHTHASNNYYMARRYPNLIDEAAVGRFIAVTHEAYYQRLKPYFGATIEAFFTDEPSLMTTNIGPLPDDVRKKVRVADPLDPNVVPLPAVPWVADLPKLYRQRYGEDLMAVRQSLFVGDSTEDRRVRRQYWALVADLLADRYYGRIEHWAQAHDVASSGHILWEEMLFHHAALEGNTLKVLARMDVPGLDLLNSWPEAVIHSGWMTAGMPASAAVLNGGRRVMTEVSDFSQTMAGQGPVSVTDMCATAAWQAALGVTEFNLYYSRDQRTPQQYNAYCTYVGRLNALLREAQPTPHVVLYYPIADVWSEYKPVGEKLTPESQSPRLQRIVGSFMGLGQRLTRGQVSFVMADHEMLAAARVEGNSLYLADKPFRAVVLPAEVSLPEATAAVLKRFEAAGGCVLRETAGRKIDPVTVASVYVNGRLNEPAERLVVGRFAREGRAMILVVNVSDTGCKRTMTLHDADRWVAADPATGAITAVETTGPGQVTLALPAKAARVFIGPTDSR